MNFKVSTVYNIHCKRFLRNCVFNRFMNSTTEKPIIYGDEISPPVRFVMMTASILNIDINFQKIDLFKNENRSEFFKKINPLKKVPTMLIGESAIADSHAISIYLCQIANDSKLYPEEPMLRAKVNQMLFYNSSVLFPIDSDILSAYFANRWPLNKKIEQWFLALDYLESNLNTNPWLVGNEMRLCDVCTVAVVTSMCGLIPLSKRHNKIQIWIKKFEQLPFYYLNKQGLNTLYNHIDEMSKVYKS